MDPRDFLRIAAELAERTDAAALRSSLSRAYYAVYGFGTELLRGTSVAVPGGPAGHGELQRYLSNCPDADAMGVGASLLELHHRRIQADYQMARRDAENPNTARWAVQLAARMIRVLEACATEPKRTQVIAGIQEYKRRVSGGQD